MHIPDAYLSPATELVAYIVMTPIWITAIRRTSKTLTSRQIPLLSIGAAFCFAVQMFNIPAIGGTTAHALGAALLSILVGPWAAVLGMTLTLAIQALLFGDGGILSLGANCFDMGFVACFVGSWGFRVLSRNAPMDSIRALLAAGFSAYAGTVVASLCAGIFLGTQPLIAHDGAGHALYCPFGLHVTVPAMVIAHLLIAGPAEAIITVAALSYLARVCPDLIARKVRPVRLGGSFKLLRGLAFVLCLTPLGLLASGGGFGEWEADEVRKMVGYTPKGMFQGHSLVHPLLPDYGFASVSGHLAEILGYLLSALIGSAAIAIFARSMIRKTNLDAVQVERIVHAQSSVPVWMTVKNPEGPNPKRVRSNWIETSLLKMRNTIAETLATENIARSKGWMQSIPAGCKTLGCLTALILSNISTSPWELVALFSAVIFLARFSQVPMRPFLCRAVSCAAFFGLILAIPLSLRAVTPGPAVLDLAGIQFSMAGLHSASMILLRLLAGISIAQLWTLTTRWNQLIRSLNLLGVPVPILSTMMLTYRFLFVIVETLAQMVEARTSRQLTSFSRAQARTYVGTGTAVLFAKSLALSEETYLAMQARGFDVSLSRKTNRGPGSLLMKWEAPAA